MLEGCVRNIFAWTADFLSLLLIGARANTGDIVEGNEYSDHFLNPPKWGKMQRAQMPFNNATRLEAETRGNAFQTEVPLFIV